MKNIKSVEVLIVEDNPYDAELSLRVLLKHHLAEVLYVVEDGKEALDFIFCRGKYASRIKNRSLKVVFLDLQLPMISGLEVLREIKSNPETEKLPVVILTSSKEDPDITTAFELGANSYVVKPVDFSNFVTSLEKAGLFWLLMKVQEE
jgi:two-component system, response regulator